MIAYYKSTNYQRDCLQAIAAIDSEACGLSLKAWLDDHYNEPVNHAFQILQTLKESGHCVS